VGKGKLFWFFSVGFGVGKKHPIEILLLGNTMIGLFDSISLPFATLQVQSILDLKQNLLLQWVHVDACRV